jgi:hypothetical protein
MTGVEMGMLQRFALSLILCLLSFQTAHAITVLDTSAVNKSVVFLFGADPDGKRNNQLATGFLVRVPTKDGQNGSFFLVTARHVVDPLLGRVFDRESEPAICESQQEAL